MYKLVNASEDTHFTDMSLLHALGWRTTYQNAVPADYIAREITDTRWVPFFRADYETGRCAGLLLYRGNQPVSCCTYGPARIGAAPEQRSLVTFDSSGYEGWGEIISFYTHPDEKGKGYGSRLMEETLRRLTTDAFPSAYLLVLRENENARRFYEKRGFTWDGTQEEIPFPPNNICVDLRYTRAL